MRSEIPQEPKAHWKRTPGRQMLLSVWCWQKCRSEMTHMPQTPSALTRLPLSHFPTAPNGYSDSHLPLSSISKFPSLLSPQQERPFPLDIG